MTRPFILKEITIGSLLSRISSTAVVCSGPSYNRLLTILHEMFVSIAYFSQISLLTPSVGTDLVRK